MTRPHPDDDLVVAALLCAPPEGATRWTIKSLAAAIRHGSNFQRTREAVQRLRYAGKIDFKDLVLSPSMRVAPCHDETGDSAGPTGAGLPPLGTAPVGEIIKAPWSDAELAILRVAAKSVVNVDQVMASLPGRTARAIVNRIKKLRADEGLSVKRAPVLPHELPPIGGLAKDAAITRDMAHGSARLLKRMLQTGLHWIQDEALFHARWAEVRRA